MVFNIVAIKDMSSETETWQETKIFKSDEPISKVIEWATPRGQKHTSKHITITSPHV